MTLQPTVIYATRGGVPLAPADGPGLRSARDTANLCDLAQGLAEEVEARLSVVETPLGVSSKYSRVTNAAILSVDLCDRRIASWAVPSSPAALITLRVETLADDERAPVLTLPAIFVGVEPAHTGSGSFSVAAQAFLIDSIIGFDNSHPVMNSLSHGSPTAQVISEPMAVNAHYPWLGDKAGPDFRTIDTGAVRSLSEIIQAELLREAVALRVPGAER
jgi:hypothetical protein